MKWFENTPMKEQELECYGCGSLRVNILYMPKYRGFRGICPDCGSNWPAS